MAKVFTIPPAAPDRKARQRKADADGTESQETSVLTLPTRPPDLGPRKRERRSDPRYVDGQKMLVAAMNYLVKSDRDGHRSAIELLSEHVRTRFRMSDRPLS